MDHILFQGWSGAGAVAIVTVAAYLAHGWRQGWLHVTQA